MVKKVSIQKLNLPHRFAIKLEQDIKYLLSYEGINIQTIILFGSCARGTYKVSSDIDLLVVTEHTLERYVRGDIASELDEAVDDVRTDVVFYGREVFQSAESLLIKEIRREGVILYDAV